VGDGKGRIEKAAEKKKDKKEKAGEKKHIRNSF